MPHSRSKSAKKHSDKCRQKKSAKNVQPSTLGLPISKNSSNVFKIEIPNEINAEDASSWAHESHTIVTCDQFKSTESSSSRSAEMGNKKSRRSSSGLRNFSDSKRLRSLNSLGNFNAPCDDQKITIKMPHNLPIQDNVRENFFVMNKRMTTCDDIRELMSKSGVASDEEHDEKDKQQTLMSNDSLLDNFSASKQDCLGASMESEPQRNYELHALQRYDESSAQCDVIMDHLCSSGYPGSSALKQYHTVLKGSESPELQQPSDSCTSIFLQNCESRALQQPCKESSSSNQPRKPPILLHSFEKSSALQKLCEAKKSCDLPALHHCESSESLALQHTYESPVVEQPHESCAVPQPCELSALQQSCESLTLDCGNLPSSQHCDWLVVGQPFLLHSSSGCPTTQHFNCPTLQHCDLSSSQDELSSLQQQHSLQQQQHPPLLHHHHLHLLQRYDQPPVQQHPSQQQSQNMLSAIEHMPSLQQHGTPPPQQNPMASPLQDDMPSLQLQSNLSALKQQQPSYDPLQPDLTSFPQCFDSQYDASLQQSYDLPPLPDELSLLQQQYPASPHQSSLQQCIDSLALKCKLPSYDLSSLQSDSPSLQKHDNSLKSQLDLPLLQHYDSAALLHEMPSGQQCDLAASQHELSSPKQSCYLPASQLYDSPAVQQYYSSPVSQLDKASGRDDSPSLQPCYESLTSQPDDLSSLRQYNDSHVSKQHTDDSLSLEQYKNLPALQPDGSSSKKHHDLPASQSVYDLALQKCVSPAKQPDDSSPFQQYFDSSALQPDASPSPQQCSDSSPSQPDSSPSQLSLASSQAEQVDLSSSQSGLRTDDNLFSQQCNLSSSQQQCNLPSLPAWTDSIESSEKNTSLAADCCGLFDPISDDSGSGSGTPFQEVLENFSKYENYVSILECRLPNLDWNTLNFSQSDKVGDMSTVQPPPAPSEPKKLKRLEHQPSVAAEKSATNPSMHKSLFMAYQKLKEAREFSKTHRIPPSKADIFVARNKLDVKHSALWVRGLAKETRTFHLSALFSMLGGKVLNVMIATNPDSPRKEFFAYITMSSDEEASDCATYLQNVQLHGSVLDIHKTEVSFTPKSQQHDGSSSDILDVHQSICAPTPPVS